MLIYLHMGTPQHAAPYPVRIHSFGSLQTIEADDDGNVQAEYAIFKDEGNDHTHDDQHEICFVTSGKGVILIDNKPTEVSKGDKLVIKPGQCHRMRPHVSSSAPFEMVILYRP